MFCAYTSMHSFFCPKCSGLTCGFGISQVDDILHYGQIHLHVDRVHVCSAAYPGGHLSVSVPAAVLPTLLRSGDESQNSHHGCCVQEGTCYFLHLCSLRIGVQPPWLP